ncbi:MAG: thioredoxin-disulfide reductase [Deltaproteobacteria bacterium]
MSSKIPFIDKNLFERKLIENTLPVAVVFSSDSCPSCKVLLSKLENFYSDYSEQIYLYKLLRNENTYLTEKYEIKNVPTIIIFNNGKEVSKRLVGNVSTKEIESFFSPFIKKKSYNKEIEKILCDVLIIGGGPAGLSSAIYSSREGLKTIIIEEGLPGGKLLTTENISNYPGTKGTAKGKILAKNMIKQAENFGTTIHSLALIQEVILTASHKRILTDSAEYEAKAVIIATGAEPRKLNVEGEEHFGGKGIHYCAICDGPLYKNKDIIVVGGGNSALKEASFLSKYAERITIVHQFETFQASKIIQDEISKNKKIRLALNSEVRKLIGKNNLSGVVVQNTKTGFYSEFDTQGVFVYIGLSPKTAFLRNQLITSENGYIVVNENMESNIKGVFAAGDVRKKNIRQIVTAVSDGSIAALSAFEYINS